MFTHDTLDILPCQKCVPKLDITAAGRNSAEWKTFSHTLFIHFHPSVHLLWAQNITLAACIQSFAELHKEAQGVLWSWLETSVHLPNITAASNNPAAHRDLWGSSASTLAEKCVHDSLTEHHTPISTSVPLSPCVWLCAWGICLSHRAIIQLHSQRQVARSVIFDKLCWLPHFCCIWEPYTGMLMDRGGSGSEPFNHCIYSLLQNYSKTAVTCTSGKWLAQHTVSRQQSCV